MEATRCAGITMLGKTVELCPFEIRVNCPPTYFSLLDETLDEVCSHPLHFFFEAATL